MCLHLTAGPSSYQLWAGPSRRFIQSNTAKSLSSMKIQPLHHPRHRRWTASQTLQASASSLACLTREMAVTCPSDWRAREAAGRAGVGVRVRALLGAGGAGYGVHRWHRGTASVTRRWGWKRGACRAGVEGLHAALTHCGGDTRGNHRGHALRGEGGGGGRGGGAWSGGDADWKPIAPPSPQQTGGSTLWVDMRQSPQRPRRSSQSQQPLAACYPITLDIDLETQVRAGGVKLTDPQKRQLDAFWVANGVQSQSHRRGLIRRAEQQGRGRALHCTSVPRPHVVLASLYPYTQHPDTLHPTPYTLHPTPYTLHPTPHTLHPTPYTPHPTSCTLHPTSTTLPPTFQREVGGDPRCPT